MNLIAAVDEKWGIGKDGQLLVRIPLDQKMFRNDTLGKVCIMGRKTFESLPDSRPLDGRVNIVLTTREDFHPKGVDVCHSLEEVFELIKERGYKDEDLFVIGGGQIYELFLPYCDIAHITKIEYEYHADTHMVNLDKAPDWVLVAEGDEEFYFNILYSFKLYKKLKK